MAIDPNKVKQITDEIAVDANTLAGVAGVMGSVFPQATLAALALKGLAALSPIVAQEIINLAARGDPSADEVAAFNKTVDDLVNW